MTKKDLAQMKVALATWKDRIAPVFDVAREVHLIEIESGQIRSEVVKVFPEETVASKVSHLSDLNVQVLICGAISRPLEELLSSYGFRVIPFVSGSLREIMDAWLAGSLEGTTFAMPGCQGRRRRCRHRGGRRFEKGGDVS